MSRSKVDPTKPESGWDKLADDLNDRGPKVEDLAQKGDELETTPVDPSKSIDAED